MSKLQAKLQRAQQALQQGQFQEAKRLYLAICPKLKKDADAWLNLGFVHARLGELSEAIPCFEKAVTLRPRAAEAHFNLAMAQAGTGRLHDAARAYARAATLKPDWLDAHFNRAQLAQRLGDYPAAIDGYGKVLALQAGAIDARLGLAACHHALGQSEVAEQYLEPLLEQAPAHPQALFLAANIARQKGALESALGYARKLRQSHPREAAVALLEAQILERQGEHGQAMALIEPWLNRPVIEPGMAVLFARLCQPLQRCDEALEKIGTALRQPMASRQSHADLLYAAGDLCDRVGRFDEAFDHIQQANTLAIAGFDSDGHERYIDQIIETFSPDFFRHAPRAPAPLKPPLFILGMPRSGTSLVEQILASHPGVSAGGELTCLDRIGRDADFPAGIPQLDHATLTQMAGRYSDELAAISTDSRYVSDKMPQNFLYLGLIALLFPGAKIVHCRRHPLDTCLSCYFQNFNAGQGYSNDLTTLGRYYNDYHRLMNHWRQNLPLEMVEIDYEALIDAPETTLRPLFDYLELPWDEGCLRFHENSQPVATASYQQVRQPLYRHAIGRWSHYRERLQPLIAALEPELLK